MTAILYRRTPVEEKQMNTLKAVVCALGLSVVVAAGSACGSDPLKKLEEFTDQMCACKDQACVDKVNKDMTEWMKANADKAKDPNEGDREKASKIMERMMNCAKEAAGGSGDKAKSE